MVVGRVEVEAGGPAGHSYRGVVLTGEHGAVLEHARRARFSGWVGPQEHAHVVLVPSSRHLLVASDGRDLEGLATDLADPFGPVLVVEVVRDRLLSLVLPTGHGPGAAAAPGTAAEPLRYLSDPSVLDAEDLDSPRGAHHAPALARAFGVPGVAGALRDVLSESLDPEHYIESERVARVLGLLDLPTWLVSAWTLPRRPSYGPDGASITRLGAGVPGLPGWPARWAGEPVRRVRQLLTRRPDGPRPDGLAVGGFDDTGLW
ncbi:hypothetical protein [Aquipuribacter sp. MA13-6]|uniref:hypothetical protein n=1 Tax=unclassified Aquipuribacter TaxID=2635084 RepID=UPI003EE9C38B